MRHKTLAVFLAFVLACSILAWRVQSTSRAVANEHAQRVVAICTAVNKTRQGIDNFLHQTIVAPPTASLAEKNEITDFLTKADHSFQQIPCDKDGK